ncbi:MAG: OsmC family protein [Sulfurimonas sp.]|jgi:putative redox protein
MKISISHLNEMKFEAKTEKNSFIINCPEISPLEYFLSGVISCSATDMILLPKNQGKTVSNLVIDGEAIRNDDFPKKINTLHLDYRFDSDADDIAAARYVMASLETYCSAINTIRTDVAISYSITHNGIKIRENEKMISGQSKIDMGAIESCPS